MPIIDVACFILLERNAMCLLGIIVHLCLSRLAYSEPHNFPVIGLAVCGIAVDTSVRAMRDCTSAKYSTGKLLVIGRNRL